MKRKIKDMTSTKEKVEKMKQGDNVNIEKSN
jgi:hypothetical protein